MKTFLMVTIIIIAVIIIAFLSVYAYYGGFTSIKLYTKEQGGEILVYESVKGDYKQTSEVSNKIYYALLNNEKIPTTKGFGIFYDNPDKVEKSELRSEVGCIVENIDEETLAKLSAKYNIKKLPVTNNVICEFPFKGGLSTILGVIRVYPKLNDYCVKNNITESPIMEIYDVPNKKIIYRKPILSE